MRIKFPAIIVLVGLLASSLPVFAHHGGAQEYDAAKTIGPFTGTVTKVSISYPHPQVFFDLKGKDGKLEHWATVIRRTPLMLKERGWAKTAIKVGDTITLTMNPHKTASTVGQARRIVINGKLLDEDVN